MSYESELQAIVSRFNAQTTVPTVLWDGFNAPTDDTDTPAIDPADFGAAIWARLTVGPVPRAVAPVSGVSRPGPVGLGADAPTYREGLITTQHFGPRGSGMDLLLPYVEETRATFHRARFGNVVCKDVDPVDIVGPDGEWFQVNTTTPYYVLEIFEEAMAADRVTETYEQTAHGLTVGKATGLTASGFALARANSADTLADGVVSRVRTADKFDITHEGRVTVSAHGYGAAGTRLYLSQATAGLLTATAPLSGLRQEVARVWDENTILVRPRTAESL